MAQRLIEVILPDSQKSRALDLLKKFDLKALWLENFQTKVLVRFVLSEDVSDPVIDNFEQVFGKDPDFNLIIFPLSASLPKVDSGKPKRGQGNKEQEKQQKIARISKEELYENAVKASRANVTYILLTMLSTVIAAAGVIAEDVITVMGAAMIAPLLGPNVAFSLGTVLSDRRLMKSALRSAFLGLAVSLLLSLVIGIVFRLDLPNSFITVGTVMVDLRNIVVALAAGIAGALAFSTGLSSILAGVVVAVALLPPLVRLGIISGTGSWQSAWQAFLLFMVNIICVNLACVVTFFLIGIRSGPQKEEDEKSKKTSLLGILVWLCLLALFAVLMFISKKRG